MSRRSSSSWSATAIPRRPTTPSPTARFRTTTARVGGIFCANTDDTQRVIGERQLALLRELAAATGDARSWQQACERSARALATDPRDLPFALIYLVEPGGRSAIARRRGGDRARSSRGRAGARARPARPWPLAAVHDDHKPRVVSELDIGVRGRAFPPAPGSSGRRQRGRPADPGERRDRPGRLPRRRPQSVPAVRRRLSGFPRAGRGPDRRRHRQRRRLRGGAPPRRGAGRARPRQDRVLLQRQPRVPHAADADARPARGRAGRAGRRRAAGDHGAGRRSRIATACGCSSWSTRCSTSRASRRGGRRPASSRSTSPAAPPSSPARSARRWSGPACGFASTARRWPSRSMSTATCGRRSSSTCSPTRSSSPSRARSRSSVRPGADGRSAELTVRDTGTGIPAGASCRACSSASTASRAPAAAASRAPASASRWCRSWSGCTAARSASTANRAGQHVHHPAAVRCRAPAERKRPQQRAAAPDRGSRPGLFAGSCGLARRAAGRTG